MKRCLMEIVRSRSRKKMIDMIYFGLFMEDSLGTRIQKRLTNLWKI